MKLKHVIAAAAMAVVASTGFAADTALSGGGYGDATHPFTFTFDATGFNTLLIDFFAPQASVSSVNLSGVGALTYSAGSASYHYSGAISGGSHSLTATFSNATGFGLGGVLSQSTTAPTAGSAAGLTSGAGGTVSAVPEPESYAMMLAGLGALGFVARRRKAK